MLPKHPVELDSVNFASSPIFLPSYSYLPQAKLDSTYQSSLLFLKDFFFVDFMLSADFGLVFFEAGDAENAEVGLDSRHELVGAIHLWSDLRPKIAVVARNLSDGFLYGRFREYQNMAGTNTSLKYIINREAVKHESPGGAERTPG